MKYGMILAVCFLATSAIAHDGVKNPAVKARMHNMGLIGAASKTLGDMAKGKTAFDADQANAAVTRLADEAGRITPLFEAKEDDPKSEARPEIWISFSDFSAKAEALRTAAVGVEELTSLDQVRAALPKIGEACKACHQAYRD